MPFSAYLRLYCGRERRLVCIYSKHGGSERRLVIKRVFCGRWFYEKEEAVRAYHL